MARFSRHSLVMLLPLALALGGCPDKPKIKPGPTFVCPDVKQYSRTEKARMLQELEDYEDRIPALAGAIDDYGSLRAALEKCAGKRSG